MRDALRFPLAGEPLEALVPRGGRATIVVEPPALPLPGSPRTRGARRSPRPATSSSALASRPSGRRSSSRAASRADSGRRELEPLVTPEFARRFRGQRRGARRRGDDLVEIGDGDAPLRVHRALVETDLVVR